jgi:hypothetical protein
MSLWSAGLFGGAIPDSGNLYANYDFRENNGSLPIVDQTGNGYDLDQGSFRGVGETINGNQAGHFSRSDNDGVYISSTDWDQLDSPYTVYTVQRLDDSTSRQALWAGSVQGSTNFPFEFRDEDGFGWRNEAIPFSTGDRTSTYKITANRVESGDHFIQLESNTYTDTTTNTDFALDEFNVGFDRDSGRNLDGAVGHILVYSVGHSFGSNTTGDDVLNFLNNEWSVTV